MKASEIWKKQRPALEKELAKQQDPAEMIRTARHSINQLEQDLLSDIHCEIFRQQAGILTGLARQSLDMITIRNEIIPEKKKEHTIPALPASVAALCVAAVLIYGILKNDLLLQILPAGIIVCCIWGFLSMQIPNRKKEKDKPGFHSYPVYTDLLERMDQMIFLLEQSLNDLEYLREHEEHPSEATRAPSLSSVSDLLESLTVLNSDTKGNTERSAQQLLESMGLKSVEYSEDNAALFDVLPSKTTTCTLSPAILDRSNGTVLRRGTAAVIQTATQGTVKELL